MKSKLAVGAIVGAVVGGVVGIMVAPRSGKETREDIKDATSRALDKAAATRDDVLIKADDALTDARVKADSFSDRIKAKFGK